MSLGVYLENLTNELRKKVGSNKGVCIIAIVKDLPAFHADLLNGDIVRKINDIEVLNIDHFAGLITENKGKQIEMEIFRDGKTIVKQIQLN